MAKEKLMPIFRALYSWPFGELLKSPTVTKLRGSPVAIVAEAEEMMVVDNADKSTSKRVVVTQAVLGVTVLVVVIVPVEVI